MANLNKVSLIGRCTRDAEIKTFANGGKVAQVGFAVNNNKKNQQTGAWESEPVFLDCEMFNRETGSKLADTAEKYLKKGSQCYLEGHLKMDKWKDKTSGQDRQKLKIVVDMIQLLDGKPNGEQAASTAPAADEWGQGQPASPQTAAAVANRDDPPF